MKKVSTPPFSEEMLIGKTKGLVFRLKALKFKRLGEIYVRSGQDENAFRMFVLACWYHEHAHKLGYASSAFLYDYAAVLGILGKEQQAAAYFAKSLAQKEIEQPTNNN